MADCKITFNREEENNYSSLHGETEDILFGLAHLVATFAYDSTDAHAPAEVEVVRSATLEYLSAATLHIVEHFYKEDAESV